jgi:mRNA interferase HigB
LRIISKKRLREFWEKHPDAKAKLEDWYNTTRKAHWRNIADVRATLRHADPVGTCTVFNIKENDYRLITRISYTRQRVCVRDVLTHAEYDKGKWKDDCKS